MNSWTGKPELTTEEDISNDGFWVDLSMHELMTWMRIPSEYDNDTIVQELIVSIIEINRQLTPIKAALITDYDSLSAYCDANSEQIGGTEVLIQKYTEAVFCYAKAVLLGQFPTINRKEIAENEAKEAPETQAYFMNRSLQAVLFFFKKFDIDSTELESPSSVWVGSV